MIINPFSHSYIISNRKGSKQTIEEIEEINKNTKIFV